MLLAALLAVEMAAAATGAGMVRVGAEVEGVAKAQEAGAEAAGVQVVRAEVAAVRVGGGEVVAGAAAVGGMGAVGAEE